MTVKNHVMANDKENSNEEQKEHHKSWLERAVEQEDTDFPLSGGEEDEDLDDGTDDEDDENADDENTDDETTSSFRDDLETDFPLSGGEVDHD